MRRLSSHRLNELPLSGYQKFVPCKRCGQRFRQLHGLRLFCERCKPPQKGGAASSRQK